MDMSTELLPTTCSTLLPKLARLPAYSDPDTMPSK